MTDIDKVIRGLEKIMADNPFDSRYDAVDDAITLLKEQPEIVRCKDCANRGTSRCPGHYSGDPYIDWKPDDDWFCADGEKE